MNWRSCVIRHAAGLTCALILASCGADTSSVSVGRASQPTPAPVVALRTPVAGECASEIEEASFWTEGDGFASAQEALEFETDRGYLPPIEQLTPGQHTVGRAEWHVVEPDGLIVRTYSFNGYDDLWNLEYVWECRRP